MQKFSAVREAKKEDSRAGTAAKVSHHNLNFIVYLKSTKENMIKLRSRTLNRRSNGRSKLPTMPTILDATMNQKQLERMSEQPTDEVIPDWVDKVSLDWGAQNYKMKR